MRAIRQIINENGHTNNNILLVTHQGVCTSILERIKKITKIDINTKEYDKGKLSLILDENKWDYKQLN